MSLLVGFESDRLQPTEFADDPNVFWIVSLEFAGHVIRLGDAEIEVFSDTGEAVLVSAGILSVDHEDVLDLPIGEGVDAEPPSIAVSCVFPEPFDVAALVAQGHPLDGGPVEVAVWIEGTTWEERRIVLEGTIADPSYGEPGEECRFSADGSPGTDAGLVPDAAAVVGFETWDNPPDGSLGLAYPLIIGAPGGAGRKIGGSTAIVLDESDRTALVAGHAVEAATVRIRDDDEMTPWQQVNVVEDTDRAGRTVATIVLPDPQYSTGRVIFVGIILPGDTVTLDGSAVFTGVNGARTPGNNDFDVSGTLTAMATDLAAAINDPLNSAVGIATATSAGVVTLVSSATPGAGGAISLGSSTSTAPEQIPTDGTTGAANDHWLIEHTFSIAWSDGGGLGRTRGPGLLETAGEVLEYLLAKTSLRVDAGKTRTASSLLADIRIAASIEAGTSPYDWIRAHLLPILPISLVAGPRGLYPVVWRWWSTPSDAIGDVDVDRDGLARVGPVQVAGDPASSVVLSYARDLGLDQYVLQATSSGLYSRASELRHGPRIVTLESDVLYDPASAARVVAWIQASRWTRRRTIAYQGPRSVIAPLLPGDRYTWTDQRLSIESELVIVASVSGLDTSAPTVVITLVDPPRGL